MTVARKVSSRFTAPLIGADVDGPVPWLATAYIAGPSLSYAVVEHGPGRRPGRASTPQAARQTPDPADRSGGSRCFVTETHKPASAGV